MRKVADQVANGFDAGIIKEADIAIVLELCNAKKAPLRRRHWEIYWAYGIDTNMLYQKENN